MINNDYTSDPGKDSRRRTCSCECNLARLKRGDGFIAFVPAPARASRAASGYAGSPDLPFAGLQSALGSLPSVALSSAGANGLLCREFKSLHGECFPFPFPWGSIDG